MQYITFLESRLKWAGMATAVVVGLFSSIGGCLLLRRNR
jgi:hypothetical protein